MRRFLILMFLIMLIGCATNPFKSYYNDSTGGIDILKAPAVLITDEAPKIFRGNNPEEDGQGMLEEGYSLLGYSSFNSGEVAERQAIAYGKEIHASAIIYYSKYTNTLSGAMPLTLPDTQTSITQGMGTTQSSGNIYGSGLNANYSGSTNYFGSATTKTYGSKTTYIPYNVNRYDYLATFWVKRKPSILGAITNDLTPEFKKQIGSNKGVLIRAIIKNSPAFSADLLKGDIIRKANDVEVLDPESFSKFLVVNAGRKVTFSLIRDGKELTKTIQLNPLNT